jgi:hypothetical protein
MFIILKILWWKLSCFKSDVSLTESVTEYLSAISILDGVRSILYKSRILLIKAESPHLPPIIVPHILIMVDRCKLSASLTRINACK